MTHPILVPNTDSVIWEKDRVVAELAIAMMSGKPFEISMNREGPCAESLGMYDLLDTLCLKYRFPCDKITIHTCNQIETHNKYNIKKIAPIKGINDLQKKYSQNIPYKVISSDTKHFSNFVSRGNRMRLVIASDLYLKYRDKTLQSYHTDVKNSYFFYHIGLEEVMFHDYSPEIVDLCFCFLKETPITIDAIDSYPILHGDKVYDILMKYRTIFVDIVNLPYFSGNTFYLDEKIWRPILTKTPFIVQGPKNFLNNLKKLGFQTFDRWWDEGYSEDPPDYQVRLILDLVKTIAAWDTQKLSMVYDEMKPILDHNCEIFLNLDEKVFKQTFNYV